MASTFCTLSVFALSNHRANTQLHGGRGGEGGDQIALFAML